MAGIGTDREIVIVDEQNRPVGTATRREALLKRLIHRAIHCVVHDAQGRVHLPRHVDPVFAGRFDLLTEHVWPGEEYEDTVRRALALRLGISNANPRPLTEPFRDRDDHRDIAEYDNREIVDDRFLRIFRACCDGAIQYDERVYQQGEWRTPDEIDTLIASDPERFTRHFRKDWTRVRNSLNGSWAAN